MLVEVEVVSIVVSVVEVVVVTLVEVVTLGSVVLVDVTVVVVDVVVVAGTVVVVGGGIVVVVVVQPGMRACVQPAGTLHASTVQASKSSQKGVRQVASQQAFGGPPVSHVSGNSTI